MEKPEVWFSMVEAMFEDCTVTNSKQRYNKVLYRLPVAVMESLAMLVSNIEDYRGREYVELKKRVLTAHGRLRWEKLDSLLSFPKMGVNERPSVVLFRLNSLKPATLEELYMAIILRLLPDSYREQFAQCELGTATTIEAVVAAMAMVAAEVDSTGTRSPHLGEPCSRTAATSPPTVVTCTWGLQGDWPLLPPLQLRPPGHQMQAAIPLQPGKQEGHGSN
jgi:hypothetical protein